MHDLCAIRRPNNQLVIGVFTIPGDFPCNGTTYTRTTISMVEGPTLTPVERWIIDSWDVKGDGDCVDASVEYFLKHELKSNNAWKLLEIESYTSRWNASGKFIGTNGRTCWESDNDFTIIEEVDQLVMNRTGMGIPWISTALPCPGIKVRSEGICICPDGYTSINDTPCCADDGGGTDTCPPGWIVVDGECTLPDIVTPWHVGRPCDFSIYVRDNWNLTRISDSCYAPRPSWEIGTQDRVTGYITGGVGYGNIIIPEGPICSGSVWWFRNPDEICGRKSRRPICWYQQFLWMMIYPQIPQSTIVRTPGLEGDTPPNAPGEISSISLFPPVVINQFYTMGECP